MAAGPRPGAGNIGKDLELSRMLESMTFRKFRRNTETIGIGTGMLGGRGALGPGVRMSRREAVRGLGGQPGPARTPWMSGQNHKWDAAAILDQAGAKMNWGRK